MHSHHVSVLGRGSGEQKLRMGCLLGHKAPDGAYGALCPQKLNSLCCATSKVWCNSTHLFMDGFIRCHEETEGLDLLYFMYTG